jgi:predicted GH43/DUF377 family glycosyl hydrolase
MSGELGKHRIAAGLLAAVVLAVMWLTLYGAHEGVRDARRGAEPSLFVRSAANPVYRSSASAWNFAGIGDPSVFHDSNQKVYKMWLSSGGVVRPKTEVVVRIQYLTSKDGINWREFPTNPVLMEGGDGEWDRGGVETPFVLKEGGSYWIWYGGYDKRRQPPMGMSIGLATSPDGVSWTKSPANPVLSPGPPGSWDDGWVESPTVVKTKEGFYMWYSGVNRSQEYRIGLATSEDGIHWVKHRSNPVLSPDPAHPWESGVVYAPSVLREGNQFRMWYVGLNASTFMNAIRLGMATSPDGIVWTRSTHNPVLGLGARGAWDEKGPFVPSALFQDGQYWLWYLSGKNPKERIGLATWTPLCRITSKSKPGLTASPH